jgi:hypothetical protein
MSAAILVVVIFGVPGWSHCFKHELQPTDGTIDTALL